MVVHYTQYCLKVISYCPQFDCACIYVLFGETLTEGMWLIQTTHITNMVLHINNGMDQIQLFIADNISYSVIQ